MPAEHPTGEYRAKVLDHGFAPAGTGTMQFWVKYQTESGEIVGFFAMTDKAVEYTAEKVKAMGYQGGDWRELADGSALRGAECMIEVREHTNPNNGVTRNQVNAVWPVDGEKPGRLSHADPAAANVARFNAVLKRTTGAKRPPSVKAFDEAEAEDAAKAARGEEFDPGDDSIPF